ncbi:MAG: hypothetical protein WCH01_08350 [Methylococcaceae bacterium]
MPSLDLPVLANLVNNLISQIYRNGKTDTDIATTGPNYGCINTDKFPLEVD